ncbi:MAG: hypothetical protein CMM87_01895 [Rickettsiales bacterium]|nr:hypothetical protein [Rickettsiales bacterium]|tara:strand:- start:21469 stop:22596 length:1128 start_codon:yes stop_codon:yes gene_type:complete
MRNSALFFIIWMVSLTLLSVNKDDLLTYFPDEYKSNAHEILDEVCGRNAYGPLPDTDGDFAVGRIKYPIAPETLDLMLKNVKGANVIEFGCACGELSLLFVLAGARSVMLNDLDKNLLERAVARYNSFPLTLQQATKAYFKRGDCVRLSQKEAESNKGNYNIIIARNILHLLGKADVLAFISGIQEVSASGALINLTAHTIQSSLLVSELMDTPEGERILTEFKQGYSSFFRHRFDMGVPSMRMFSLLSYYEPYLKEISEESPMQVKAQTFCEPLMNQFLVEARKTITGNQKEVVIEKLTEKLNETAFFKHGIALPIIYNATVQVFYRWEMLVGLFDDELVHVQKGGYFLQSMHFKEGEAPNNEICSAEVVMVKR